MNPEFKKKVFIAAALALALFLAILLVAYIQGLVAKADSAISLLEAERKGTKTWQDEAGRWRAQAQVGEATNKMIAETYAGEVKALRGQFDGLKTNLSNLKQYITTKVETSGTVTTVLRDTVYINQGDTTQAKTFLYSDEWLMLDGTIFDDSIKVSYYVKDSLTFVSYYKKRKLTELFKKPELLIDAISYNPHSRVSKIRSLAVAPPRNKRIVVVAYAGYDPFNKTPSVGLGVGFKLIEF